MRVPIDPEVAASAEFPEVILRARRSLQTLLQKALEAARLKPATP